MSNIIKKNNGFTTKLKDEQFLRFADKSTIGVLIIQKGYIKYFNQRFCEIFGYSQEEILNWKKREFYKIIHPEDKKVLCNKMQVDDENVISIHYRGIKKDGIIINIENFACKIKYNDCFAVLSSYSKINDHNIINNQKKGYISLNVPLELYKNLIKISKHKKITIEKLVIEDLKNLVEYYKEQFKLIDLFL